MNKKNIIKTIVFLGMLLALFIYVTGVFTPKWIDGTSVTLVHDQMYALEDNSVDVMVLGSSQMVYGMSSMYMLKEHGISAFSCATGEQPIACAVFYLNELTKNQDIKTVIYDTSMLFEGEQESRFRKTLDSAPLSRNKLNLIMKHIETGDEETTEDFWAYLFPIGKYHTRWTELEESDYDYEGVNNEVIRGNILSKQVSHTIDYDKLIIDNDKIDSNIKFNENELNNFNELIDICKQKEIELILVKTPKVTWNKTCHNMVKELADNKNLEFLDFNTAELLKDSEIDYTQDFWNDDHLNFKGACKISEYMCKYLLDKNDYEDARKTETYKDEDVKRFEQEIEDGYLKTSYDIDEILKCLKNERYKVYVKMTGDIGEFWSDDLRAKLNETDLRIPLDEIKIDYLIPEEDVKQDVAGHKVKFGKKGLNIAVYDKQNKKVVDGLTLYVDTVDNSLKVFRR